MVFALFESNDRIGGHSHTHHIDVFNQKVSVDTGFIVFNKNLFTLFTPVTRNSILAISLAGFTFYSFSNFVWDLPHTDFRPFKIGNNIREMKKSEKEAAAAVKIVAYKMTNLKSGEIVEVPFDTYTLEYSKTGFGTFKKI